MKAEIEFLMLINKKVASLYLNENEILGGKIPLTCENFSCDSNSQDYYSYERCYGIGGISDDYVSEKKLPIIEYYQKGRKGHPYPDVIFHDKHLEISSVVSIRRICISVSNRGQLEYLPNSCHFSHIFKKIPAGFYWLFIDTIDNREYVGSFTVY